MATQPDPNKRTASTTYAWRKVKIRPSGDSPSKTSPKASSSALKPWPRGASLSVTIKHRGGAESWWEITARGHVWRRPGHLLLDDVLQEVLDGKRGKPLTRG